MRATVGVKTTLLVVLEAIKTGRWKDQVSKYRETKDSLLKENFPCFTVSGVFTPTKSVSNLVEQSGYLSLDIDNFEGVYGEDLFGIVAGVLSDNLFAFFRSSGGNGFCALIKIPNFTDDKHFKRIYHSIYTALEPSLSKISKFDYLPNVNRLRYISYDERTYINKNVEDWTKELEPPTQVELPLPKSEKKITITTNSLTEQEKYDLVVSKYVSVTGHFGSNGGTRHDWVLGLARWLCRGGVSMDYATSQILTDYQNSARLAVWNQEVRKCVRDSYRAYSVESGSYEPSKKFSYDDILRCSNTEEIREQVLLLIADKINYKEYLEANKKPTTFIEREIKFYTKLINFI